MKIKITLILSLLCFSTLVLFCKPSSANLNSDLLSSDSVIIRIDTLPHLDLDADFFAYPVIGNFPLSVSFNALNCAGSTETYSWDFGDGCTGNGSTVEHIYESSGEFNAVLTISYGHRQVSSSTLVSAQDSLSLTESLRSINEDIENYRLMNHPETKVSFWAQSLNHGAVYANENETWPSASSIKIFILMASYCEFGDKWDSIPDELDLILGYDQGYEGPLEVFDRPTRIVIEEKLRGMSYRELAISMMGNNQNTIGNSAYNAASNVLIFLLGGVEGGCTSRIQSIHPEFNSVRVGRYMIDSRTIENDNINSMADFALACRMIYQNSIPGLSLQEHMEIRDCFQHSIFNGCDNYQKHGHLTSAPGVNSWIGWLVKDNNMLFYGVNVLNPNGISISDAGADHYRDMIRQRLFDAYN